MRTLFLVAILRRSAFWICWILCSNSFFTTTHADSFSVDTDQYYGDHDVFLTNTIPGISPFLPPDEQLEAAGAVIGKIYIQVKDIFNLQNPKENKSIFRLANKLHIITKPHIVQDIVLFRTGDKYSSSLMRESERKLRDKSYLYDARVLPVNYEGNEVDVVVIVRDVWSLAVIINLSREGGENSSRFGISESNLLGYGQGLEFERRSDVDRTELSLAYVNQELFGSRNQLTLKHSDNSDGKHDLFRFEQPFYALDTRLSYGISNENTQEIDSRYEGGEVRDRYHAETTTQEMFLGFSSGLTGNSALRWSWGLRAQENIYHHLDGQADILLPEDSNLVYGFLTLAKVEDRFLRTRRVFQVGVTEDISVGVDTSLTFGFLSEALGSDKDGVIFDASMETGYLISDNQYLFVELDGSGRIEDEARDITFSSELQYIYSINERQSYYLKLELNTAGYTVNEDKFYMGGDSGVRGYPLRYQSGNRSALLTIERHYYTDIELWHVAHVGGAIFFDIGRAWHSSVVNNPDPGALRDIGFGIRLAPTRLSLKRVFHIDFAFPLDGDDSVNSFEFYAKAREQF